MDHRIVSAIENRQLIGLDYEPGERIIEPHAYGLSRDMNELLRAYQVSGASASGEHEHWKLFRVDRIRSLTVLDEQFPSSRPGYRSGDSAMRGGIFVEL